MKRTSIRLWIVTLIRTEHTCILVLLRDCHFGLRTVMCPLSILRETDGWMDMDTHEIMSYRGKYDALRESAVQGHIVHYTAQANCPVIKPGTPWWCCILLQSDNLGGSVRQHSDFQTVVRTPVLVRRFMPVLKVCCHYSLTFSRLMTYIYMSHRTANLQMLHFIYLFNKYTYWIF